MGMTAKSQVPYLTDFYSRTLEYHSLYYNRFDIASAVTVC
jgi:hypothetical protein